MTGSRMPVPPELLEFQRTFQAPPGRSAVELLIAHDEYMNGDPPQVAATHRNVPLREVAGWRVGADISVPLGEPPFPTLVYLHGGGWVMGAPWTHRRLSAELASRGLLVISVDYRRAPKHRFPAAVEDCAHAVGWAVEHAHEYGGDPDRLVLGGDSAGGNLTASVLAAGLADSVKAALLLYGIYDFHRAISSLGPLLGGVQPDSQPYLPIAEFEQLRGDPRLSPEGHCAGLPPSLVMVGDGDPLLVESTALAARLTEAGASHELLVIEDAPHGFLQLPTHPAHDLGLATIERFLSGLGLLATRPS
jgi:acetyl esterase